MRTFFTFRPGVIRSSSNKDCMYFRWWKISVCFFALILYCLTLSLNSLISLLFRVLETIGTLSEGRGTVSVGWVVVAVTVIEGVDVVVIKGIGVIAFVEIEVYRDFVQQICTKCKCRVFKTAL